MTAASILADIVCVGPRSRQHVVARVTVGEGGVCNDLTVVRDGARWQAPGSPAETPVLHLRCPVHGWDTVDLAALWKRTHARPNASEQAKFGRLTVQINAPDE